MVFIIQCPNSRCKKFMLVEDAQRNQLVNCLICKEPIKVGSPGSPKPGSQDKSSGKP